MLTTWVKVWSYDHRRGLTDDNYHKILCCINISCYPCCLGWHKLRHKEGSVGARGRSTSEATGKSAKYRQAAMLHKSPRSMMYPKPNPAKVAKMIVVMEILTKSLNYYAEFVIVYPCQHQSKSDIGDG